jgi:hypothetical protein
MNRFSLERLKTIENNVKNPLSQSFEKKAS